MSYNVFPHLADTVAVPYPLSMPYSADARGSIAEYRERSTTVVTLSENDDFLVLSTPQ